MEAEHLLFGLIVFGLYGAAVFSLLYGRRCALIRRILRLHDWRYRNPYDRTCRVCGRHEVEHGFDMDPRRGWWEVFTEGRRAVPCNLRTEETSDESP